MSQPKQGNPRMGLIQRSKRGAFYDAVKKWGCKSF